MRFRWRALLPFLLTASLLTVAPEPATVTVTRVMVVGDSISQGSAGDHTWRYRLVRRLAESAPGTVDLVGPFTLLFDDVARQQGSPAYADPAFDRSHNATWGRRLAEEKAVIAEKVADHQPDLLLVLLGINDLEYEGVSPAQVAQDMREFIDNARSARPSLAIVVGHTLSRHDRSTRVQQSPFTTAELNVRLDALAAELDNPASRVLTADTDAGWDPRVHTWDGTHPNPTGEVRIAAAFVDALATVGIGNPYGARPSYVPWTGAGSRPAVTRLAGTARLSWAATPGATGYMIEQRVVGAGESGFIRLPTPVKGTTWTAQLPPGGGMEVRVVPVKGWMAGLPGPAVTITIALALTS